ncbi:MAG TPA: GNAT family N-acetyltransferase [Vicinamibacterales bacterium]|jgi:putative acetyltransferase|nr:GNAT family N-acetyltransferase [Vicinamibacterales bacterium]
MRIELDDVSRPEVLALLEEHLRNMYELTPPEQVFAFDATKLRAPDVTMWTVWDGDQLIGCGALKELSATAGEIKSMRTPAALRRRGAGRAILEHIIGVARARGYRDLFLETGAHPGFAAAHQLYASAGFQRCGAFGSYVATGNNVFMHLSLTPEA